MASVFIGDYHIYYSIVDGRIHEFEKKDQNGTYVVVDSEPELITVTKDIIAAQAMNGHGYSAFIYKLVDDGKVKLPLNYDRDE